MERPKKAAAYADLGLAGFVKPVDVVDLTSPSVCPSEGRRRAATTRASLYGQRTPLVQIAGIAIECHSMEVSHADTQERVRGPAR